VNRPSSLRSVFRATVLVSACALASVAGAATLTARVVDAAGAPVVDAVVYAIPAVATPKPPAPGEVSQVNRTFAPLVTVVQTGAAVSFPNRDTVKHQIYSFSPAKVFQLKLYAGLPEAPIVFDKPGLVVLGCNIHDAMLAYILVVDTPYFGKTGPNGVVRIDHLPPGDFQVTTWHFRMTAPLPARAVSLAGDLKIDSVVDLKP
jgi:plastocyanin